MKSVPWVDNILRLSVGLLLTYCYLTYDSNSNSNSNPLNIFSRNKSSSLSNMSALKPGDAFPEGVKFR